MSKNNRGFASDNNAGVHPDIFKSMASVNKGHTIAYGDDEYTRHATEKIRSLFRTGSDVFFVYNGTAANVLGLDAVTKPHHAIICAETSHIHEDECGAPERWTGCKLLFLPTRDGKLRISDIQKHMHGFDFEHHVQPRVISITQSTELGTVYRPEEIEEITYYAHRHGLLVHMDGARICNAAAFLNSSLARITCEAGVDILSFGGTKNGLMFGEVVIFFHKDHSADFKYLRKQGMQLASKMRFISAQFDAYLRDDLWLKNARHANRMAQLLAEEVRDIKGITITQKVESNAVFATLPPGMVSELQKEYFFYVWNENTSEVRWMCSFDNTEQDIIRFAGLLREKMKGGA